MARRLFGPIHRFGKSSPSATADRSSASGAGASLGVEERIDLPAQIPASGHKRGSCGLNREQACSRIGVGIGRALEKQRGAHKNQDN